MALEIVSFRKKKDGDWQRIRVEGMASKNDKGGLDITLFTVPVASDGMIRLVVQPRQEQSQGGSGQGGYAPQDEVGF